MASTSRTAVGTWLTVRFDTSRVATPLRTSSRRGRRDHNRRHTLGPALPWRDLAGLGDRPLRAGARGPARDDRGRVANPAGRSGGSRSPAPAGAGVASPPCPTTCPSSRNQRFVAGIARAAPSRRMRGRDREPHVGTSARCGGRGSGTGGKALSGAGAPHRGLRGIAVPNPAIPRPLDCRREMPPTCRRRRRGRTRAGRGPRSRRTHPTDDSTLRARHRWRHPAERGPAPRPATAAARSCATVSLTSSPQGDEVRSGRWVDGGVVGTRLGVRQASSSRGHVHSHRKRGTT